MISEKAQNQINLDNNKSKTDILFLGNSGISSLDGNNKAKKVNRGFSLSDHRNLIYFKNLNFDLTFLFELQANFFEMVVESYKHVYTNVCDFVDERKSNPMLGKE